MIRFSLSNKFTLVIFKLYFTLLNGEKFNGLFLATIMSRYQMVMGRNSSKRNRTKDEPDIMRWVLNLVVPLMTLFGILNLVVSGEAVEGLYKFFKNKGSPGFDINLLSLSRINDVLMCSHTLSFEIVQSYSTKI